MKFSSQFEQFIIMEYHHLYAGGFWLSTMG